LPKSAAESPSRRRCERSPFAENRAGVASPSGASVPLGQLAAITLDTGPAQISREAVRRRIVVEANVRGRDVASFVAEARKRLAREVLRTATAGGATAAETDVSQGIGLSVTVRKGEVETIAYNRDKGIGVTVYIGERPKAPRRRFSRIELYS